MSLVVGRLIGTFGIGVSQGVLFSRAWCYGSIYRHFFLQWATPYLDQSTWSPKTPTHLVKTRPIGRQSLLDRLLLAISVSGANPDANGRRSQVVRMPTPEKVLSQAQQTRPFAHPRTYILDCFLLVHNGVLPVRRGRG